MSKVKTIPRSRSISWGGYSGDVKSQSALNSQLNQYQHTTAQKEKSEEVDKDYSIVYRGSCNHAPQKDIELGKRSITHRAIADQLAYLNGGKGIEFYVPLAEKENRELTSDELLDLEIAKEFKDNGLSNSIKTIANGLTYQNLSSLIVTHEIADIGDSIVLSPSFFVSHPSEQLRFSTSELNEFAEKIVKYHYYHKNWNFDPTVSPDKEKASIPSIVSIPKYLSKQDSELAFAVPTSKNDEAKKSRFVSFPFTLGQGIFDNSYPLPSWKTDSSINDIQSEFESSCIRIDYLRNGLHIFAMVNVYSVLYNDMVEGEDIESATDKLIEDTEAIKQLKGSFAAGRIVVNVLTTQDPEKDGMIEIKEIDLKFDSEGVRYFNEEARSATLTAWGVMADLFSVSKPEKSNLRSQGEFLKIGILLLNEKTRQYHAAIEKGINGILDFYDLGSVRAKVLPHESSVYLSVMSDFASDYMELNEIRDKILNIDKKTEEEIEKILAQKGITSTPVNPTDNE